MNRQEDGSIIADHASIFYVGDTLDWERNRREAEEKWDRLAVLLGIEPLGQSEGRGISIHGTRGWYDLVDMLYRVASMAIEKRDEQEQHA